MNKCPVSSFLQLGNISSIAVVTVALPGNRVQSIYGTLAAETTNTTFLFGMCSKILCNFPEEGRKKLEGEKGLFFASSLSWNIIWCFITFLMYSVCFDLVSFSFECTILTPSVSVSDRERPEVQLSTIAPAKTKSHIIPVLIQFTEPVFLFNSSDVTISGGNLTRQAHKFQSTPLDIPLLVWAFVAFCLFLNYGYHSHSATRNFNSNYNTSQFQRIFCLTQLSDTWFCSFKQVSETTYALEVYIFDNSLMRIAVPENKTMDIAGNLNLASPILKVQHCKFHCCRLTISSPNSCLISAHLKLFGFTDTRKPLLWVCRYGTKSLSGTLFLYYSWPSDHSLSLSCSFSVICKSSSCRCSL